MVVLIERAPHRLEAEHAALFTADARAFLEALVERFAPPLDAALAARRARRLDIAAGRWVAEFRNDSAAQPQWQVAALPQRLRNRQLDLGDVSPANGAHFRDALFASGVQGIQVDFDDGHCPTWRNTVAGLYNVRAAVWGLGLVGVGGGGGGGPEDMRRAPLLMMRPRAFNMVEQNCMINGRKPPAALFDYALLVHHCAERQHRLGIGPFFYLSKIEDPLETQLWNDIFVWTQQRLHLPPATIKACVLIENILAAYRMEDILYALREHAIGLNCGIWDYAASIIAKFGDCERGRFVLPDRQKYVNMEQPFLCDYRTLLVATCHRRGALATGGMAAQLLPFGGGGDNDAAHAAIVEAVRRAKRAEIAAGVDGFMVYDLRLVEPMRELWAEALAPRGVGAVNQLAWVPEYRHVRPEALVAMPSGGVTYVGLRKNIAVTLLFIYHWLSGSGVFHFDNAVEDSATAEISRSQIWQWLRNATSLESDAQHSSADDDSSACVTYELVYRQLDDVMRELRRSLCRSQADQKRLQSAKYMLLELVTAREFVEYVTTYLSESHKFRALHNKSEGLEAKL